jgi:hypothetical protein
MPASGPLADIANRLTGVRSLLEAEVARPVRSEPDQRIRECDVMEEAAHWPSPANCLQPDRLFPTGGPGTRLGLSGS